MQPITILNTTAVNGHTYTAGTTYQVNASTFRQLVEGGAVKREILRQPLEVTTKADAAVFTLPIDSHEVPKLQPEAPAKQPVRRTRNTRK